MKKIGVLTTISCMLFFQLAAQDHSAALANADTSNFSVSDGTGWQLFNSYIGKTGSDSVLIELILQKSMRIKWDEEHFVGTIKGLNLRPSSQRLLLIKLGVLVFQLRIEKDGKCHLKQAVGEPPTTYPFIFPLTGYYKL